MTTRSLHLSKDLALPLDAATESFAILGRRGSGKTHTAVVMAEEMLKAGVQVVVIDPLDVWWGLRVSKDGKTAGFPIYVAGGSHHDIPLTADAGKVLADAVVDQGLSIVLSTRHLSKTDQRRFVGEFCERLYDRKADPQHRTALHVDIDEADAFVPQRLMPGAERCFGAVDTMVRRGRSSGLAVTLISQRPQVINKDVLSQTEVLVSHQLTGPQDRKALQAWIEANDDENRSAEFMGALASLPKGRAWFWSPGLLKVFRPVDVRDRTTFDSSATPKPGVAGVKPKAFAAVDLKKLTAEIAATIEKAKADDPRELRKQIAELKQQVAEGIKNIPAPAAKEKRVGVLTDGDRALLASVGAKVEEVQRLLTVNTRFDVDDLLGEIARQLAQFKQDLWNEQSDNRDAFLKILDAKGVQKILGKLPTYTPTTHSEAGSRTTPAASQGRRVAPAAATSRPASLPPSRAAAPAVDGEVRLNRLAERKVLQVLSQFERRTVSQLAIQTGYAGSGGGFKGALSKLRTAGYITGDPSALAITEAGRAAIGEVEPLPTGAALVSHWMQQFNRLAEREVLRVVVAAYPNAISAEDVASQTNPPYEPEGGGFKGAVSKLRTLGLIEGRGELRASEELF